MFALAFVCMLAAASAAPHFRHGYPFARMEDLDSWDHGGFMDTDVFDTGRFWQHLETELEQVEKMLSQFHRHFPGASSSAVVEGNQYKVKVPLPGFEEKDIVVKARDGMLMIQAVHKSADGIMETNRVDIRTLPSNIDAAGTWTYSDEVLTITFPLKVASTEATATETIHVTIAPEVSREEVDISERFGGSEDDQDADVGTTGEKTKETEINTNEIPKQSVEATTYLVDLKDQYEFVPIHY